MLARHPVCGRHRAASQQTLLRQVHIPQTRFDAKTLQRAS